jgi:hypothetical protein
VSRGLSVLLTRVVLLARLRARLMPMSVRTRLELCWSRSCERRFRPLYYCTLTS